MLLKYFHAGDSSEDDSDETRSGGNKVDSPTALSSRFDERSPRPIQYPDCLKMILQEINQFVGEPSPAQVKVWCEQMEEDLTVSTHRIRAICTSTSAQSSSPLWYKERVCTCAA